MSAFCYAGEVRAPYGLSFVGPNPGFEGIKTSMGPIGRSVGDLELFCRAIFDAEDPTWEVVPVLYREVQLPRRLKFGYYTTGEIIFDVWA